MAHSIIECKHPEYISMWLEWEKWRRSWYGGRYYVDKYLERFSIREDWDDFQNRKNITPPSMFATTRILDIANAIYDRMSDIRRESTSKTYMSCIDGKNRGVDLANSSMNYFIGINVLQELLFMGKVGVYIDMPDIMPSNYSESINLRPYLYYYKTEDIKSWHRNKYDGKLDTLLLSDNIECCDSQDNVYNLVSTYQTRYRYYQRIDNKVLLTLYNHEGVIEQTIELNIPEIPFVVFKLPHSLMSYVADYQISLMNIESSDLSFILKANFPTYVEMYDFRSEATLASKPIRQDPANPSTEGSHSKNEAATPEKQIGTRRGLRFPAGEHMKYPEYISPPIDSVKISIEKQQQIKNEIITLLNKSLASLKVNRTSAESKQQEVTHEEQGLNYIGLELNRGELEIARIWQLYEQNKDNNITIMYPTVYTLKNDETRIAEADNLTKLKTAVPSEKYRKELSKRIVRTLFLGKIDTEALNQIYKEVDNTNGGIELDSKSIASDVEIGILSPETASKLRGYPDGEVEKAAEAHAERAARILLAQQSVANQGNKDLAADPKDASRTKESVKDPTLDSNPSTTKVRGEGQ